MKAICFPCLGPGFPTITSCFLGLLARKEPKKEEGGHACWLQAPSTFLVRHNADMPKRGGFAPSGSAMRMCMCPQASHAAPCGPPSLCSSRVHSSRSWARGWDPWEGIMGSRGQVRSSEFKMEGAISQAPNGSTVSVPGLSVYGLITAIEREARAQVKAQVQVQVQVQVRARSGCL
ncbi:hypothetical protein CPAR01_14740 [Colletotrichum paranaense]|uniref:Uncharacterized protein n=1 Tax=Colletotrichum paranaense TaxID=1914294 RepID=A0ABQ9S1C7_9PEZI|nr:uncharacterized protein CPAR01_14740 [Colletotrichum paranaense]KAK1521823.1 hypothetical protein CPAR01_14740 [Colletotrichum paranaense]